MVTQAASKTITPSISPIPLWVHPFGDMVRPDRALPVAWSFARDWLPLLGAERWALILALRIAVSADGRQGSDLPVRVSSQNGSPYCRLSTAISDLAPWAGMDRRRLGDILKGESIPPLADWWNNEAPHDFIKLFTMIHLTHLSCHNGEKGWQRLALPTAGDGRKAAQMSRNRSQTCYMRLFIPRWRYTYEKATGHRSGIELELLADDVPPPSMAESVVDAWLSQVRALILLHQPGVIPPDLIAELGTLEEKLNSPRRLMTICKTLWRIFALGGDQLWRMFTIGRPLWQIFANYTYDTSDSLSAKAERDPTLSSPSAPPKTATTQSSIPSPATPTPQNDPGGIALEATKTIGTSTLSRGGVMSSPTSTPQPGGLAGTLDGGAVGSDVWIWNERESWVQRVGQDLKRLKREGNSTGRLVQAIWDLFTIAGKPDRTDFAAFETSSQGAGQIWQRACALDRRLALAGQPGAVPLEMLWQALAGTNYPVEARRALGLDLTAIERLPNEPGIAAWQRRTAWIAVVRNTLERLSRNGGNAVGRLGTALWELCQLSGQPDSDTYAALGLLSKTHGPLAVWKRACGLSAQAAMQGVSLSRPVEMLQAGFESSGGQATIASTKTVSLIGEPSSPVKTRTYNNPTADPLLSRVMMLYETNFGRPAPLMARKIKKAIADYTDPEGWEIAFSHACEPGVSKPWGYMLEVLAERRRRGVNRVQDNMNEKQPINGVEPNDDIHPPQAISPPRPTPEHTRVWQTVLGELQLQMTKGTFTTWLADTRAAGINGNTLIVIVPSIQAQAWLEERLGTVIARTVHNISQHLENVRFVLANEDNLEDPHP
ncbi:MAG: hypothetical protein JXA42_03965 [Anaerolineales bacterium]|nr:hypothetical protein [Anaerolineales bacterium]